MLGSQRRFVDSLAYELRMAVHGLRRHPGLTFAVFLCLALGAGSWTGITAHLFRDLSLTTPLPPHLCQVELPQPRVKAFAEARHAAGDRFAGFGRRVTFPEYRALASSGLPVRQVGSFRASVLVAAALTSPQPVPARFVEGAFFEIFRLPLAAGRGFPAGETEPVAVLSARLARTLCGGACTGRIVRVEGRPVRVVGVLARPGPLRPPWDLSSSAGDEDSLYLPMAHARALGAWPQRAVWQSPPRVRGEIADVYTSDAVFVWFWIELPTPALFAEYQRYLSTRFAPGGFHLRNPAQLEARFPDPPSDISFYVWLIGVGLLGSAFSAARLLLAKGVASTEREGIFRALGATRGDLFLRLLLEGALLAVPAALAGVAIGAGFNALFNAFALSNDVPVVSSSGSIAIGGSVAFLVGLAAAAYPAWRLSRTSPTVALGRL